MRGSHCTRAEPLLWVLWLNGWAWGVDGGLAFRDLCSQTLRLKDAGMPVVKRSLVGTVITQDTLSTVSLGITSASITPAVSEDAGNSLVSVVDLAATMLCKNSPGNTAWTWL
jgi:hypothetical protein